MTYYICYTHKPHDGFTPICDRTAVTASSKIEAFDTFRETTFPKCHGKSEILTDVKYIHTEAEEESHKVFIPHRLAILLDISTREHIKSLDHFLNQPSFTTFNTEQTINALKEDYALLNNFRNDIGCSVM